MELDVIEINSFDEYYSYTEKLEKQGWWFRGQPCASFRLIPSLFRLKMVVPLDEDSKGMQTYALPDEKTAILKLQKHLNTINNDNLTFIQTMYKAQHNGIPTRLLDFSSDKLVALYFATNSPIKTRSNHDNYSEDMLEFSVNYVSVFCINPIECNLLIQKKPVVFSVKDLDINLIYKNDLPVAIEPEYSDVRMKAQKSRFLIFGKMQMPFDYYEAIRKKIVKKIVIKKNICNSIFEHLRRIDYSHKDIFPDEEGYIMEVKYEMMRNYRSILDYQ